jgi:hypothetical protein
MYECGHRREGERGSCWRLRTRLHGRVWVIDGGRIVAMADPLGPPPRGGSLEGATRVAQARRILLSIIRFNWAS